MSNQPSHDPESCPECWHPLRGEGAYASSREFAEATAIVNAGPTTTGGKVALRVLIGDMQIQIQLDPDVAMDLAAGIAATTRHLKYGAESHAWST